MVYSCIDLRGNFDQLNNETIPNLRLCRVRDLLQDLRIDLDPHQRRILSTKEADFENTQSPNKETLEKWHRLDEFDQTYLRELNTILSQDAHSLAD